MGHKLICGHLDKKRKVEYNYNALELLRQITDGNVDDAIRQLARIWTMQDIQRLVSLPNSGFMTTDDMSRGMRLFWYENIAFHYPFFFTTDRLGAFDPSVNYYRISVPRVYAERAISFNEQDRGQYLMTHPEHGTFSVIAFDSVEYDGTHLTLFNSIGLPNSITPEAIDLFSRIVDELRVRNARVETIERVAAGFFGNRAVVYLTVDQIAYVFQQLFQAGYMPNR
jgi:hypothetical protein